MKKIMTVLLLSLFLTFPLAAMAAININTADAATLASELPGIGPSKASAIVEHREKYGSFKTVDDLTDVSGIGETTLENIRHLITVGGTESSSNAPSSTGGDSE